MKQDLTFTLIREQSLPTKTLGKLYLINQFIGYILEDRIRPNGEYVYGETAIPAGKYRIIISYSNRFKKQMTQLINIRGGNILFGNRPIDVCGVRIHGGNTEADSHGCPLLGENFDTVEGKVYNCAKINQRLIDIVTEADKRGEVYLEIINAFTNA